jgi:hypothetical protein
MLFGSRLNRLATSIRRGISKYSVGSDNPGLVFDFIDNFYQKDKNQTVNFDGAITHARSGNAVMTDGYGPELVTNGGFDSDSDWFKDSGWSISDGSAHRSNTGSTTYLSQSVTFVAGKTYAVSYNLTRTSGGSTVQFIGGTSASGSFQNSSGFKTEFITANSGNATLRFQGSSSFAGSIDNVSVRKMPVLKWAPHNELTYSEDLTNGWGVQNGSIGSTGTADPNGVTTNTTLFIPSATSSNQHRVIGNNTSIFISSYRLSFWLKPSGYTKVGFRNGVTGEYAAFSLVGAGTVINTSNCTATIVQDGDWYFCSVERDNVSGIRADIYTFDNGYTSGNPNGYTYTGDGTSGVYIWGAHIYRSDLGGMVDNPERGDSYVPTTSSARYLPRVGHHVFNGNAWVNEGVLAESESRVNLDVDSNTFTEAGNATVTADQAVSPSGETDAWLYDENVANNNNTCVFGVHTTVAGTTYTSSVYVKYKAGSGIVGLIHRSNDFNNQFFSWFDIQNGEALTLESGSGTMTSLTSTIEDVGNGWYRISSVGTDTAQSQYNPFLTLVTADNSKTRETDAQCYVWQSQFEAGSTPSSLIPTSGQQGTREAETFTIPSANLPWPTPQYIGSELVTNGTFDTDLSGWTAGSSWSWVSGKAYDGDTQSGTHAELAQLISVTSGKVYAISFDISGLSGGNPTVSWAGSNLVQITADGSYEEYVVATASNHTLQFSGQNAIYYVDNISVREINPLSVSIGMEGRMTYADEDALGVITFWDWKLSNSDNLSTNFDTRGSDTGQPYITMKTNNNGNIIVGPSQAYAPDIFVPFNISARYGSTFINGGVDGSLMNTAINHTDGLPDLSSTDLNLAYDYMGTISEFRVWDKDLGDDGIVEATNPSLEPSLSLTFEGVGTNSFTVSDWSE